MNKHFEAFQTRIPGTVEILIRNKTNAAQAKYEIKLLFGTFRPFWRFSSATYRGCAEK